MCKIGEDRTYPFVRYACGTTDTLITVLQGVEELTGRTMDVDISTTNPVAN